MYEITFFFNFSLSFGLDVLDAFLTKNISSLSTSTSKGEYEQACLKWLQSCAKTLVPSSSPVKETST